MLVSPLEHQQSHKHLVHSSTIVLLLETKPSWKRIISNCRQSDISPGHSCPEKEHCRRGYGGVTNEKDDDYCVMVMEYHHHTNSMHGLNPGFLAVPVSTLVHSPIYPTFVGYSCLYLSTVLYSVYSVAVIVIKGSMTATESDGMLKSCLNNDQSAWC